MRAIRSRPTEYVRLIEEPDDLARDVLSPRLLVIHDAGRGGENDDTRIDEMVEAWTIHFSMSFELDVVARADHAGLVDAAMMIRTLVLKSI